MPARFILLLILLTSPSQSTIPASTIDSDAAAITTLNEAFKANSPPIFHRLLSLTCEMINTCCPSIKPRLAEYADSFTDGGSVLAKTCIGDPKRKSLFDDCPTLHKFMTVADDKNFQKFVGALRTAGSKVQDSGIRMPQTCSSDEVYFLLCDWTERNKIESCIRRNLAHLAQNRGDDDYRTFVLDNKRNLQLLIDAMNEAFPMNNVTKMNKAFPMNNVTKIKTSGVSVGVETNWLLLTFSTTLILNASSPQRTVRMLMILLTFLLAVFFC
jgi:hypothetical protein